MSSSAGLSFEHFVPEPSERATKLLSRWSDTNVERPALVAKPKSEADVVEAVRYAREHGLYVVPVGGAHTWFVPIRSNTLYLDMRYFNAVELDEVTGIARIGGGALVGEVVSKLTLHGRYALIPNSDAPGYVGCLIGGGSSTMNGLHGFMIDAVVSFQLVTATGQRAEVSEKSQGKELELFHALSGAGHGLGVITSVQVKTWSIRGLGMPEDKVWTRSLIFPPPAVTTAVETFAKLLVEAPKLAATLIFIRNPPTAPMPGAPTIILSANYRGPWEEAEQHTQDLFNAEIVAKAVKADTIGVPWLDQNKALEPFNAHGGYKDFASTFLKDIKASSILEAYQLWLRFTEIPDAKRSIMIVGKWPTKKLVANGQDAELSRRFYSHRDCGAVVYAVPWYYDRNTVPKAKEFVEDYAAVFRRQEGGVQRIFGNNMRIGMNLEDMHDKEKIEKLRSIFRLWDPQEVFWSPYGRGWKDANSKDIVAT
jgi:FAD/FMN-containing dehydrogenase